MHDQRYQGMGFGSNTVAEARWDANIQWYELKPGVWNQIRIIGPIFIVAQNWFTTPKGKKFALFSRAWDPFKRSYCNQEIDPIYQIFGNPFDSMDERIKGISPRQTALVQAFIRPTAGLASGGDLKPMRLPSSVVNGIRKVMELNFVTNPDNTPVFGEDGKPIVADPTDADFGIDILIHYDPSKQGSEKYTVQANVRSPLTAQERVMYPSLIDWANIIKVPTENQVKEALSKNGYMSLASNSFGKVADISSSNAVVAPPTMQVAPPPMQAPMAPPAAPQYAQPAAPMAPPPMQAPQYAPPMAPPPMQAAPAPMAPPIAPPPMQAPIAPPMAPSPK